MINKYSGAKIGVLFETTKYLSKKVLLCHKFRKKEGKR